MVIGGDRGAVLRTGNDDPEQMDVNAKSSHPYPVHNDALSRNRMKQN